MRSAAGRYGEADDAEDILAEACLQLLRYAERLRELEPRQQAVYLYKLTLHTACNHHVKQKRRRVHEAEGEPEPVTEGPEQEVERRAGMRFMLDGLSPRDRDLLTYHYLWGYSVKETAQFVGLSPASAGVYLQRARQKARKLLREGGESYAI